MLLPDPANKGAWIEVTDNNHPGNTILGHYATLNDAPDISTVYINAAITVGDDHRAFIAASTIDPLIADTWTPWQQGDMRWQGLWTDRTYEQNDVVKDGDWTMICAVEGGCSDRPSPQPTGDPFYAYDDVIPESEQFGKQITYGNKYSFDSAGYVLGWRVYTFAGDSYELFSVRYEQSGEVYDPIISFVASSTGWTYGSIGSKLIPSNSTFGLIVVSREPDPTPITWTADWNYSTPQNDGDPVVGQIVHATRAVGTMRIHNTDSSGGNRAAQLQALTIGDVIRAGGLAWLIQSVTSSADHTSFTVSPGVQLAPAGQYIFSFDTVTATSIKYAEDVGYWVGTNVVGLFGTTLADVVEDSNAYGVDIHVQAAQVSDEWQLVAQSDGGAGSGGGGDLPVHGITQHVDVDTVSTPPEDDQFLGFESSTGLWVPKTYAINQWQVLASVTFPHAEESATRDISLLSGLAAEDWDMLRITVRAGLASGPDGHLYWGLLDRQAIAQLVTMNAVYESTGDLPLKFVETNRTTAPVGPITRYNQMRGQYELLGVRDRQDDSWSFSCNAATAPNYGANWLAFARGHYIVTTATTGFKGVRFTAVTPLENMNRFQGVVEGLRTA